MQKSRSSAVPGLGLPEVLPDQGGQGRGVEADQPALLYTIVEDLEGQVLEVQHGRVLDVV